MLIVGKRKRKLDKRISTLNDGTAIRFAVTLEGILAARARTIGFSSTLPTGETLLPAASLGSVCRFNAEGREIVDRDQPMETAYRQAEWHWEEWHGDMRVPNSKIVDVPYQRYPRTPIPPPGVELTIIENADGTKLLVTPETVLGEEPVNDTLHKLNVVLEIFEHCSVLSEQLQTIVLPAITKVNWEILPPGQHPWATLRQKAQPILEDAADGRRVVVEHRLEKIASFDPEFVAVGRGGFSGYFGFGFPDENLYVFESAFHGNATYVFEEEWEELSQMTKREILDDNLQKDRIIHREGWDEGIDDLLG